MTDANTPMFVTVADLLAHQQTPTKGTLSQTLHHDDVSKIVLFSFAAGEELSEHTASMPAIMHFLAGEAVVTLNGERTAARAGTWVHMRPNTKHAIRAETPLVMLLTLFRGGAVR